MTGEFFLLHVNNLYAQDPLWQTQLSLTPELNRDVYTQYIIHVSINKLCPCSYPHPPTLGKKFWICACRYQKLVGFDVQIEAKNKDIVLGASATGSEEEVNTYLSLYNFCTHFNLLYNLSPFNMFNLVVNSYLINLHRYRITTIDNFSQGTYLSQQQQYLHGLLISRQVCIGPGEKKKTERGITRAKLLFVNKPN